jgi:FkbM family methyltransferase
MTEQHLTTLLEFVDKTLGLDSIETVVETGARDCSETAAFSQRLPNASIYAFECNPATLPVCRRVVENLPNATLVEKAVADQDGTMTFYPIDPESTDTDWEDGNPGASSLFKASGEYPLERYVQNEITVSATRLGTFLEEKRIPRIDLLWMDIQGAELMALTGLGEQIRNVKVIHTELEFFEIYAGQPLFGEIKRFLNRHGFRLAAFTALGPYSADAIFINTEVTTNFWRRLDLYAREVALMITGYRQPIRQKVKRAIGSHVPVVGHRVRARAD